MLSKAKTLEGYKLDSLDGEIGAAGGGTGRFVSMGTFNILAVTLSHPEDLRFWPMPTMG